MSAACPSCPLMSPHVPLYMSSDAAAANIPLSDTSQHFVLTLSVANLNLTESLAHYNRASISNRVVSQGLTKTKPL